MKVLLSHGYFLSEDEVEKKVMRPYPPLGLLYISAFLQEKGIEHQVFDSTFSNFSDWSRNLKSQKPQILALYVNFLTRRNILKIIILIRNDPELASIKIVLGGPDVKYNINEYLNHSADYCVIGEGEQSFYELYLAISSGTDLRQVDGLAFKDESGEIIQTRVRSHIKNLDNLPFPNRLAIDINQYLIQWKKSQGYSSVSVNSQRGCPYTCKWCSHAVYGDTYRRRSVKSVVLELKEIIGNYSPDRIWFVDDVFTQSEKWISAFVDELKQNQVTIEYECISRADRLSEKVLWALKESGCRMLWVGAESGSQKVIDLMDRRVEVKKVREMIQLARQIGIDTGTFIMLGYPGETEEDIIETIHHLKLSNPDYFTINLAYPIHGTRLFNEIKEQVTNLNQWADVPDKDLDFDRTYKKRYYDFAIRKVYNEVFAARVKNNFLQYIKFKVKVIVANLGMRLYKNS